MNRQAEIAAAKEELHKAELALRAALPPESQTVFLNYETAFFSLFNAAGCLCLHDEDERRHVRASARERAGAASA